jgi:Arc/MetJ-type ribon-helix-helix transcriptional regulator
MTTGTRGNTKTITVSFPLELAVQAEQLAKMESRTMSELLREAFRTYRAGAVRKRLVAGNAYAQGRALQPYEKQDVEGMVDEARAELDAKRRKRG